MTAWHIASARISGLGLAALILTAGPLSAATAGETVSYLIQSNIDSSDGSLASAEVLTLTSNNGSTTLTVEQQGSGNVAKAVAPIDEHGVVSIATSDPALICYNTAQGIIANSAQQNGSALSVLFAGNSVTVPVTVSAAAPAGGSQTFTVGGHVEGTFDAMPQTGIAIVIDGDLRTQANHLANVRLRETTMFTASRAAIGQTSCSISRIIDAHDGSPA